MRPEEDREPRQATCVENVTKFGLAVPEICVGSDRLTGTQTHRHARYNTRHPYRDAVSP